MLGKASREVRKVIDPKSSGARCVPKSRQALRDRFAAHGLNCREQANARFQDCKARIARW